MKSFRKHLKSKKGIFQELGGLAIGLVALGITLVVVFLIFAELGQNSQVLADGNATLALQQTISATNQIPSFLPIVVITAIGALLIGLVVFFRRSA